MKERGILFSAPMVRAILDGTKVQTRRVITPQPQPFLQVTTDVHPQKHPEPYIDSYCGGKKTEANPRGMGLYWCWWTRDDRQGAVIGRCPVGVPGDRLWVRETWSQVHPLQIAAGRDSRPGRAGIPGPPPVGYRVIYRADGEYPRLHFQRGPTLGPPYREVCLPGCQREHVHPEEAWHGWAPSTHMPRWASRLTLEVTDVRVERLRDIDEAGAVAEGFWATPTPARDHFACAWNEIHAKRPERQWSADPWVWVVTFRRVE